MLRLVLGTLAGILAAVLIVFAIESLGHVIFPPPPGVDLARPEAMASIIDRLPLGALAFVVLAWMAGAFGGGAIAARLTHRPWSAWIVGVVMLAGGLWSLIVIPHPLWMKLALLPATLLPSWVASRLAPAQPFPAT
jgi:hypothetical protein